MVPYPERATEMPEFNESVNDSVAVRGPRAPGLKARRIKHPLVAGTTMFPELSAAEKDGDTKKSAAAEKSFWSISTPGNP